MTVCEILKLLLTSSTTLEVPWELSTLASPLLYAWHLGSSSMSYWTRRHQTQLPSYTVVRTEAMGGEVCVCFVAQSWPPEPIYHIDCDLVDHSLPGSSVHGDSPGILKWIAMPSSRGSSQPRDRTQVSDIAGRFFTIWATREALEEVAFPNVATIMQSVRHCWVVTESCA